MKLKQAIIWTLALVLGAVLGTFSVKYGWKPLDEFMDFLASAYTSGFKFVAIPTVALAVITALAFLGKDVHAQALLGCLTGLQKVMFAIIRGLIWALPLGIVAFAEQLARDFGGMAIGSIGKYVAVVLGGNLIQFFIILPLFCFLRGVNGYKVMRQ